MMISSWWSLRCSTILCKDLPLRLGLPSLFRYYLRCNSHPSSISRLSAQPVLQLLHYHLRCNCLHLLPLLYRCLLSMMISSWWSLRYSTILCKDLSLRLGLPSLFRYYLRCNSHPSSISRLSMLWLADLLLHCHWRYNYSHPLLLLYRCLLSMMISSWWSLRYSTIPCKDLPLRLGLPSLFRYYLRCNSHPSSISRLSAQPVLQLLHCHWRYNYSHPLLLLYKCLLSMMISSWWSLRYSTILCKDLSLRLGLPSLFRYYLRCNSHPSSISRPSMLWLADLLLHCHWRCNYSHPLLLLYRCLLSMMISSWWSLRYSTIPCKDLSLRLGLPSLSRYYLRCNSHPSSISRPSAQPVLQLLHYHWRCNCLHL